MTAQLGMIIVAAAGLSMGSSAWPVKVLKKFEFEHWWFISMLLGLVIVPWGSTFLFCNDPIGAYRSLPVWTLVKSNLFAVLWGIANVLYGICLLRIGVGLTGAIVTGLGVSVGVIVPFIMKGSGSFSNAPSILSNAGLTILTGIAVMLIGVGFAASAGFGRDRILKKTQQRSGNFVGNLVLCIIAGIASAGMSLAFVYGQGPVVAAMKARGAGDIAANLAVWAGCILSGTLVNIIYPIYLMTKKRSWNVLVENPREVGLASIIGLHVVFALVTMGKGMIMLGTLGASVGFGIQQIAQMMGTQGVGFIGGEWRGVHGKPRNMMVIAIGILVIAAVIMAYGNSLAKA